MPILGIIASGISGNLSSPSFESIQTITVSSSVSYVEFTSIPSTYQHLQIRGIARGDRASQYGSGYIRVGNGSVDTGTNYASHQVYTNGYNLYLTDSFSTASPRVLDIPSATNTTNTFAATVIDILDYANSNKYKTMQVVNGWDSNNADGNYPWHYWSGVVWSSKSAINTIRLYCGNSTYTSGTAFALYGIKG